MPETVKPLIVAVRVVGLFGLYKYRLPQQGGFSNAPILYGDNGVGKSTILKLVFHLLSAAGDRGHRNALYRAQFESLEVDLSSGVTITARQTKEGGVRLLSLAVIKNAKPIALWDFRPKSEGGWENSEASEYVFEIDANGKAQVRRNPSAKKLEKPSAPRGQRPYLEALKEHAPTLFILTADRRLDSDAVADPSDEMELRRVMRYEEAKRINDLVVRSREIALSQALAAAGKWISRKAVHGANQGSMNVHSVYGNVLRQLVAPTSSTASDLPVDVSDLVRRLAAIESKSVEYARYEFASPLNMSEFRRALGTKSRKKILAASLLKPYVESLEGRFEALSPIYRIVDKFVSIVNTLLSDKVISYGLNRPDFSRHFPAG